MDKSAITRDGMIEPCTALINIPVAWIGPLAWTNGWIVIPIGVIWVLKRIR